MIFHLSLVGFEINILENSRNYNHYTLFAEFDVLHQFLDVEKYSKSSSISIQTTLNILTQIISNTSIIITASRDFTFNFRDQFNEKNNISTIK